MNKKRLSMRKIKEIMRLKYSLNLSNREIAKSINISPGTVSRYLTMLKQAGFNWPLEDETTDEVIEKKLFVKQINSKQLSAAAINYVYTHNELKKKGVTKLLLWKEYQAKYPEAYYSYSYFCYSYKNWCKQNNLSMRQTHIAGEKLFIDYAGQTVDNVSSI